jgi:glutamate--cysteine ligase
MSIPQSGGGPIETRDDLVGFIAKGATPRERFRIGTEHEKFGFFTRDLRPVPFGGPGGIAALLDGLRRFGWQPVHEGARLIGLKGGAQGMASVSLEPGGQFELSGAPLFTLHETCREIGTHLGEVKEVADALGIKFLALGGSPLWSLAETPVMPKGRYGIMKRYMPTRGRHGLDMMFRTATVQVNLDFASEADMVKKMRVALALQPIATALFANSPFTEGKPNGYLSFRGRVWLDVDPDRSGMLPFAFEDGFGFERYVDYALGVPMYFVYRDGRFIDVAGRPFRDFLEGRIPELKGETPTLSDWADHLTTLFPEARLKSFIEMRGADSGPRGMLCALPAFWAGLLYDEPTLEAAWALVRDWTAEEREALHRAVPKSALATPFRGRTVLDIAKDTLALAHQGLKARAKAGENDRDETRYLAPLDEIVARGTTQAEELLRRYHGEWRGDIRRAFEDCAY